MIGDAEVKTKIPSVVSLHDSIGISEVGVRPELQFLASGAECQRMGVAERHTQRSMEPVRIDALADKLKLVVVGLVHGAVSCIILACKPFNLKFFSRTAKIE